MFRRHFVAQASKFMSFLMLNCSLAVQGSTNTVHAVRYTEVAHAILNTPATHPQTSIAFILYCRPLRLHPGLN